MSLSAGIGLELDCHFPRQEGHSRLQRLPETTERQLESVTPGSVFLATGRSILVRIATCVRARKVNRGCTLNRTTEGAPREETARAPGSDVFSCGEIGLGLDRHFLACPEGQSRLQRLLERGLQLLIPLIMAARHDDLLVVDGCRDQ